MVKVGFICEGDTERLLISSKNFQKLLKKLKLVCVHPIINAEGNSNLLPHNIEKHRENLKKKKADKVIILTDLDDNKDFSSIKERIKPIENEIIIISVKQIEAWFLADSETMSEFCKTPFFFEFPENEIIAYETIRKELFRLTERGYGRNAKIKFADNFINKQGFSIENAAKHPNCPSAKYFIHKLKSLNQ